MIQNRMALDMLTAAQGGTCGIIKIEYCVYIPDLSGNVSAVLRDMKNQVKAMPNESIFFLDFSPVLGEGGLVGNYIYHCYSCFDSSALWTLHFTMYYELCNPKDCVVLPNRWLERQSAIYPYE